MVRSVYTAGLEAAKIRSAARRLTRRLFLIPPRPGGGSPRAGYGGPSSIASRGRGRARRLRENQGTAHRPFVDLAACGREGGGPVVAASTGWSASVTGQPPKQRDRGQQGIVNPAVDQAVRSTPARARSTTCCAPSVTPRNASVAAPRCGRRAAVLHRADREVAANRGQPEQRGEPGALAEHPRVLAPDPDGDRAHRAEQHTDRQAGGEEGQDAIGQPVVLAVSGEQPAPPPG